MESHIEREAEGEVDVDTCVSTDGGSAVPGGKTKRRLPQEFLPGNAGGPGRPRAIDNRDYAAAFKAAFPPERVVELLNVAIAAAAKTHSTKGILAALEFALGYGIGRPKMRIESTETVSIFELLAQVDVSKPLLPDVGTVDSDARHV